MADALGGRSDRTLNVGVSSHGGSIEAMIVFAAI